MEAKVLFEQLKTRDYDPFVEVPCSSLASLIELIGADAEVDIINPANEAIAMGIASGAYLAGKKPVVLMQNSGFLNTLNALTSLNLIYDIPVLYIISWRGYSADAPEHQVVGKDSEQYLKAFGVPYLILDEKNIKQSLTAADEYISHAKKPYALLIKPDLFSPKTGKRPKSEYALERKNAIETVKAALQKEKYAIVSTNGFISRESFDAQETDDFYMMGSMGHALPLGLGIAKYSNKKIAVLDGDGSVLMQLGAMPNVLTLRQKNLMHVVFDNEVYASTDGQPTLAKYFSIDKMAALCGYKNVLKVADMKGLNSALNKLADAEGPTFLLIKVKPGNSKGCKRVSDKMTCPQIKEGFQERLRDK